MGEDLYTQWLGIAPDVRPPDYYALLGLERFCADEDAIEAATRQRLTRLDEFAMHPDRDKRDAVQDMMNEVARARVCLVNPSKRETYNEMLATRLGLPAPAAQPKPTPPPKPMPAAPAVADDAIGTARFCLARNDLDGARKALAADEVVAHGAAVEDAREIVVHIVEGDSKDPDACVSIGQCVVAPLPEGLHRGSPISIIFTYDNSGRLHVKAQDDTSGAASETFIIRKSLLTKAEMAKARRLIGDTKVD